MVKSAANLLVKWVTVSQTDRHRGAFSSLVHLGKWKFKIFVTICMNVKTCTITSYILLGMLKVPTGTKPDPNKYGSPWGYAVKPMLR